MQLRVLEYLSFSSLFDKHNCAVVGSRVALAEIVKGVDDKGMCNPLIWIPVGEAGRN